MIEATSATVRNRTSASWRSFDMCYPDLRWVCTRASTASPPAKLHAGARSNIRGRCDWRGSERENESITRNSTRRWDLDGSPGSSRLQAVQVAREESHLADVLGTCQPPDPPFQTDGEPAMRRHAVGEGVEVAGEDRGVGPRARHRRGVVGGSVQALPSRRQLEPAEEQVEAVAPALVTRLRVRVERPLAHRVALHRKEVRAVCRLRPLAER